MSTTIPLRLIVRFENRETFIRIYVPQTHTIGELITYITNEVAPDISNLVIVPNQSTQVFGSLFEIQSRPDEIFVSGARVDDVEIVTAITASEIRAPLEGIVNSTTL
jgi:hypothetical protein